MGRLAAAAVEELWQHFTTLFFEETTDDSSADLNDTNTPPTPPTHTAVMAPPIAGKHLPTTRRLDSSVTRTPPLGPHRAPDRQRDPRIFQPRNLFILAKSIVG